MSSYKIDYDKLDEYITQLDSLGATFPEKECTYSEAEDFPCLVDLYINSTMKKIKTAQISLKSLIESTSKYMSNLKENVISNDEAAAGNIAGDGSNAQGSGSIIGSR